MRTERGLSRADGLAFSLSRSQMQLSVRVRPLVLSSLLSGSVTAQICYDAHHDASYHIIRHSILLPLTLVCV
jgi:hypothetical protein